MRAWDQTLAANVHRGLMKRRCVCCISTCFSTSADVLTVTVFLCPSSQPEGATSEEEAIHLSEEGLPGSDSGSGVSGVKPGVDSSGSTGPLQPREQNYYQGKILLHKIKWKPEDITGSCSCLYHEVSSSAVTTNKLLLSANCFPTGPCIFSYGVKL